MSKQFEEQSAVPHTSFTAKQIEEKVRKIIVAQLDISEEDVRLEASFKDDLNADSLDLVELLMAMEEKFDIEIPDEDAEEIQSVQGAINYIQKRITR
jgi:acyl carrier protein